MTAKEYLSQIRLLTARLEMIDSNINTIREEQLTLRSAWPDGQPHGTKTGDPTSQKAIELADKLKQYEYKQIQLKSKLWQKKMEIINTIDMVNDSKCNMLLFFRYVECLTWVEIAERMGYTYKHVESNLHNRALQIVDELLGGKNGYK